MATHPRKRRRRKRSSLPLFALLFILVLLSVSLYRSNHVLQTTKFDPVFADLPSAFDGCKIVVLSDLHGAEFGADNTDLLAAVAAEAPEHADDFLAQLLKHKIQTIIRHNNETIAIFSSTASSWYQCPEYV